MCIRSADAERTHATASRAFGSSPRCQRIANIERTVFNIDLWVWIFVVQRRWNLFIMQRHRDLDQTRYAGCGNCVTNIAFDTSDRTVLFRIGIAGFIGRVFKHASQRCHFDWIADRRRGSMSFDIANGLRINIRH